MKSTPSNKHHPLRLQKAYLYLRIGEIASHLCPGKARAMMPVTLVYVRMATMEAREHQPHFSQLREDFGYSCAYCTINKWDMNDLWRYFQTDHFERVKDRPDLECVYTNLIYACECCNNVKKWASARGMPNPCDGNLHTKHLRLTSKGVFEAITSKGRNMAKALRLASRLDLPRFIKARTKRRELIDKLRTQYLSKIGEIEELQRVINKTHSSVKQGIMSDLAILINKIHEMERLLTAFPDDTNPPPFP